MVIKVYISGMSGSKEVKKRQQRVTMILDSKHIDYTIVDITEPGQEAEKAFMQEHSEHNGATISDQNPRHPLPPQMFNDAEYCGDYDDFDLANEVDNLEVFLKMEAPKAPAAAAEVSEDQQHTNGTGDADQDQQSQVTATEADDDENKENKTEEGANEAIFSEEPAEAEDAAEQRELLEAAAAMGKREDAEEDEDEDPQQEDIEIAEEDEVSGKLGDTDDPMLVEQEQEE